VARRSSILHTKAPRPPKSLRKRFLVFRFHKCRATFTRRRSSASLRARDQDVLCTIDSPTVDLGIMVITHGSGRTHCGSKSTSEFEHSAHQFDDMRHLEGTASEGWAVLLSSTFCRILPCVCTLICCRQVGFVAGGVAVSLMLRRLAVLVRPHQCLPSLQKIIQPDETGTVFRPYTFSPLICRCRAPAPAQLGDCGSK